MRNYLACHIQMDVRNSKNKKKPYLIPTQNLEIEFALHLQSSLQNRKFLLPTCL